MGIYQEIIDHDDVFHNGITHTPIIVNDYDASTEEDLNKFRNLICTQYTADIDLLNNPPSCDCGTITGTDNLKILCRVCNTEVKEALDQELIPLVWIRKPIGIRKLINPVIWILLSDWFSASRFNIIAWFCDTRYNPTVKEPLVMKRVRALNFERGYNNFIDNFDVIMEALFQLREFRVKKIVVHDEIEDDEGVRDETIQFVDLPMQVEPELYTLIKNNRHKIFCDYLPVPNRTLVVMEQSNSDYYADPIIPQLIDSVMSFVGIDKTTQRKIDVAKNTAEDKIYSEITESAKNVALRTIENRTAKAISNWGLFYHNFCSTTAAKKEGIYRKHIFASRCEFSGRAVITSITEPHTLTEMHISWGIAITMMQSFVMNKLFRRGYTPVNAMELITAYSTRYHPLLSEIFKELISESKYGGIPCVMQRNPSLERGSMQLFFITKVYDDASIPTMAFSIITVRGFNAKYKKLL